MENATAMELTPRLWEYIGWIPRFGELLREISATRKLLPRLRVPTKTFLSAQDELVNPKAARYLEGHPYITNTLLPHSGHYAYSPEDTVLLQKELQTIIESL